MHQQFNIQQLYHSTHTVFMCFVFVWEQTATYATYSINWLVFITDMKCLQRGTDWVFTQSSLHFVCKGLNKDKLRDKKPQSFRPEQNSILGFATTNQTSRLRF